MNNMAQKNKQGFSLVELSIVLVILGLLTGGILGGQSLMHAAELRSVTKEYEQYVIAVNTFQDKYFALPGDMTKATAFWGDNTTVCADAAVTDGKTCNGDGDGSIENTAAGQAAAASQEAEMFLFWQHLALASLIQGEYSGISGITAGGNAVMGAGGNIPTSKFPTSGWTPLYQLKANNVDGTEFELDYGNHFRFGADNGTGDTTAANMTAEDAWNLDSKSDDGQPGQGKIIARFRATCADATTDVMFTAAYRLSSTGKVCALMFRDAF